MAEGYLNRWLLVSAPQETEVHFPNYVEPIDVVWLSNSTIAVAPSANSVYVERRPESRPPGNTQTRSDNNFLNISIEYGSPDLSGLRGRVGSVMEEANSASDSDMEPELADTEGNQTSDSEMEPLTGAEESNEEGNQEDESDLDPDSATQDSIMDTNQEYLSDMDLEPLPTAENSGNESPTDGSATPEAESDPEVVAPTMDENSVLIIEHEHSPETLVQRPSVVTVPEQPCEGVENPIIRLENPDYEPEPCKPVSMDTTRASQKRSYGTMLEEGDEDGQTCPVCLDMWTSEGEHRLSSLRCGHLFGKSCIIRWLSNEKRKYCPQCNKKAYPVDVRELYATKLTALDATEKAKLEQEVQSAKDEKDKLQMELVRINMNAEMYKEQLEQLKLKISKLTGDSNGNTSAGPTETRQVAKVIKFHLEKTYEISEGCCRVCAYDSLTNVMVVSHQTRNQLFPGFGIKKIQKVGTDYFGNNFLYLHSKALRDLSFHPVTSNMILSVSFDRSAKLVDLKQHKVMQTFKADYPLWCCCWDTDDPNYFYAGAGNGCVHVFDVRNPSACAASLSSAEDSSAVVAVRYVSSKPPFKGGIICCRLNSLTFYEKTGPTQFTPITIPNLMGPFFSLSYDPITEHLLVSCRPSENATKVRHVYCQFNGKECRKIHTFFGGTRQTLLSRSCFVRINNETLVAVFQENINSIDLWSTSTGAKVQSLSVPDQILDFAAVRVNSRHLFGTVSDSMIRFYETPS